MQVTSLPSGVGTLFDMVIHRGGEHTFDKRVALTGRRLREKIISDGRLAGCDLHKNLTIGIGHMVVKGRILAFDAAETSISDTTEAAGYGRLKLVIDLSQTASETEFTHSWDWDYAATNSFPALTQDDKRWHTQI